jgi:hypothetical protein
MLATYPLRKLGSNPVFARDPVPEVMDQCNEPPNLNRILIMRKEVVGMDMSFDGEQGQHALVANHGWEVVTVRQRAVYDSMKILKTGTCPDAEAPRIYVRSAESIRQEGRNYLAYTSFMHSAGLDFCGDRDFPDRGIGVVPGVFAEVQKH